MRCIGIVYLTATICSAFHVAPPLRTFTKPVCICLGSVLHLSLYLYQKLAI